MFRCKIVLYSYDDSKSIVCCVAPPYSSRPWRRFHVKNFKHRICFQIRQILRRNKDELAMFQAFCNWYLCANHWKEKNITYFEFDNSVRNWQVKIRHTMVSSAIFRDIGSRNTSNSSITRNGVSKLSPRARSRDNVVKDRSPPLIVP